MSPPPAVTSTIDLEAPGRRLGRLQYPKISNTAGWAYEFVPIISKEASRANTRMWPSGVNFNRSFPGSPDGPPNEQLADYFTRVLAWFKSHLGEPQEPSGASAVTVREPEPVAVPVD